jgi:putative hemolysin
MLKLSHHAQPAVRILSWSTDALLRLLRIRSTPGSPVTEEEIRVMIDQGSESGVLEQTERAMVERVLGLGDRRVSQFMVPRPDIIWLDLDDTPAAVRRKIERAGYSRIPVCRGDLDNVVGVVFAKDLLVAILSGSGLSLQSSLRQPLFIPQSTTALKVLEEFHRKGTHVAVVVDEHGGTTGLVTANDIAGAIVGDVVPSDQRVMSPATRRADGAWVIDGRFPIDELWTLLGLQASGPSSRGPYDTVGGLVMFQLGRVPGVGDLVELPPLKLEVTGMDGNRVETVLVRIRKRANT